MYSNNDSRERQITLHTGVKHTDHSHHCMAPVEDFVSVSFSVPHCDTPLPFERVVIDSPIRRFTIRGIRRGLYRSDAAAAGRMLLAYLLLLFYRSLRLRHFFSLWNGPKIIMILRWRKLGTRQKTIIFLFPYCQSTKIFERLLQAHLIALIDKIIRNEQFEFLKEHWKTLQLTLVITQLFEAANKRHSSAPMLLKVSRAFDRVCTNTFNTNSLFPFSRLLYYFSCDHISHRTIAHSAFTSLGPTHQSDILPLAFHKHLPSVPFYTNELPVTHTWNQFLHTWIVLGTTTLFQIAYVIPLYCPSFSSPYSQIGRGNGRSEVQCNCFLVLEQSSFLMLDLLPQ